MKVNEDLHLLRAVPPLDHAATVVPDGGPRFDR